MKHSVQAKEVNLNLYLAKLMSYNSKYMCDLNLIDCITEYETIRAISNARL